MGIRQEAHYECDKCMKQITKSYDVSPKASYVVAGPPETWVVISTYEKSTLLCENCAPQFINADVLPKREVVQ